MSRWQGKVGEGVREMKWGVTGLLGAIGKGRAEVETEIETDVEVEIEKQIKVEAQLKKGSKTDA